MSVGVAPPERKGNQLPVGGPVDCPVESEKAWKRAAERSVTGGIWGSFGTGLSTVFTGHYKTKNQNQEDRLLFTGRLKA